MYVNIYKIHTFKIQHLNIYLDIIDYYTRIKFISSFLHFSIYLQSQWRQRMRSVKEGETHIKTQERKMKSGEVHTSLLYARWQTIAFEPAKVEGGVIPGK